jgi:hypothetical protein
MCFIDEDVPGGAAAYISNKVMEEQGGYRWLDVSQEHCCKSPQAGWMTGIISKVYRVFLW